MNSQAQSAAKNNSTIMCRVQQMTELTAASVIVFKSLGLQAVSRGPAGLGHTNELAHLASAHSRMVGNACTPPHNL
jgi:hypothetical protein